MDQCELESVEKTLTTALTWWAVGSVVAASVVAGGAAGLAGRRRGALVGFGRQTAMWGAIDGAIAGVGAVARRRRGVLTDDQAAAKARTLRTILLANAAADVGYVVGGVVLTAQTRRGGQVLGMGPGDGLAIIVQGAFLLALDASQARRLSAARQAQ